MTKVDAKRKREPKERDPEQFQRFIEAARKRGMNESLEERLRTQGTARAVEIAEGHELAARAIEIRDTRTQTAGSAFVVSSRR